jgi:hypothetical protein
LVPQVGLDFQREQRDYGYSFPKGVAVKPIALVLVLVTIPALSQMKIKGHQIGESTDDFLRIETSTQNDLNDCHGNAPRRISVEELKNRKFPDGTTKRDYIELAKQGRLYDKNVDDYNRKCEPLVNLFDNGGTGELMISLSPAGSATWKFKAKKIVGLQMIVFSEYSDVRDDLTKKAGVKPVEIAVPYHNGFGATWDDRVATWLTPDLYLNLLEEANPAATNKLPFLTVETRADYEAEKKAKAAQKGPLD